MAAISEFIDVGGIGAASAGSKQETDTGNQIKSRHIFMGEGGDFISRYLVLQGRRVIGRIRLGNAPATARIP
jgi:hypothetical protein